MGKWNYYIVQLHAVLSVMGYWCMHSILSVAVGTTSSLSSIAYDGVQLAISLYVIFICRKDIIIEKGRPILLFYSILLVLYSLRMFFDMAAGPFSTTVSRNMFLNDILLTVFHCFMAAWAMITSRKYLDVRIITKIMFWMSTLTILLIILNLSIRGLGDMYEEERLDGGRGLGTLALVKIGAICTLSAFHLVMNERGKIRKIIYAAGSILGLWLTMASGSRGGLAALVIAVGICWLFASRRNVLMMILAVIAIIVFIINIVPILIWLSDYFPVVGQRMLNTILENDQNGRIELRSQAFQLIADHPLFGYSYRLGASETGYSAHNGILSVVLALGIPIGLLFIYFIYIKSFLASIKMMPQKSAFFVTSMCVFVLVASMSGSSITDPRFGFAICLLAATYYYRNRLKMKSNNSK